LPLPRSTVAVAVAVAPCALRALESVSIGMTTFDAAPTYTSRTSTPERGASRSMKPLESVPTNARAVKVPSVGIPQMTNCPEAAVVAYRAGERRTMPRGPSETSVHCARMRAGPLSGSPRDERANPMNSPSDSRATSGGQSRTSNVAPDGIAIGTRNSPSVRTSTRSNGDSMPRVSSRG